MNNDLALTSTLTLPYCWVCKKTFFPEGSDASVIRNEHHVIPRAYGGVDGPTVSLCSADHDMLHLLAQKLIASKDGEAEAILRRVEQQSVLRLQYLATRIVMAHTLLNDDPNKLKPLNLKLTGDISAKLDKLAKFYSSSRESVIVRLIAKQHTEVFQSPI